MAITIKCPAKVNLFLNIVKKEEKYHQMHMINQTISIYDTLTLKKSSSIKLSCNDKNIPTDNKNSVYKACEIFFNYTNICSGVEIHIDKKIPLMSGLGGESTDAAGALIGLNTLFDTNLTEEELLNLGFQIGCDVPFCLKGGTKEVSGYGEVLKDYPKVYNYFLVITPNNGYSTKEMFQKYDAKNDFLKLPIQIGHNDFHKVLENETLKIIELVKDSGASESCLTGSGSSIIGMYKDIESLEKSFSRLIKELNTTYKIEKASSTEK